MIKKLSSVIKYIIIFLIITAFIIKLMFQIVIINGESMIPTVQNNDKVLIEKLSYIITYPKKNDIVVIKYPADARERIIKRIIAVAGDKVKIKDNILYINGKVINEHYKNENFMKDYDEALVPQDSIFVLGDNRNFSKDSRNIDIGFVKLNLLEGKAFIRLYPFNKMGRIR